MAHIKTGGVSGGSRKPRAKRLGFKVYGGQKVKCGEIIIRQRGTKFHPGVGTKMGRDATIYATKEGTVFFREKFKDKFICVK